MTSALRLVPDRIFITGTDAERQAYADRFWDYLVRDWEWRRCHPDAEAYPMVNAPAAWRGLHLMMNLGALPAHLDLVLYQELTDHHRAVNE